MAKSWKSIRDTNRWVDDMISGEAGRSGQEAKRRRAGRLVKADKDMDRFLKQLDKEAGATRRASNVQFNRLFGPRRPPRRSK